MSFATLGIELRAGPPAEMAKLLAEDAPRWFEIIRETGIRLD
jgi:hypothetical protein